MKFQSLLVILLAIVTPLTVLGQDTKIEPKQIAPSSGNIVQIKLSPNGLHLAVMTLDTQGEPTIEVWDTDETTNSIRLVPDLTLFNGFIWSPNSQYIAVTGNRGNASGTEFSLLIYEILDEGYGPDWISPRPGRDFREFVASEDSDPRLNFAPVWNNDSRIIAANFRDGIYFYDITNCNNSECKLLYILDAGYLSLFDWQGDMLSVLSDNELQLWDVSGILG